MSLPRPRCAAPQAPSAHHRCHSCGPQLTRARATPALPLPPSQAATESPAADPSFLDMLLSQGADAADESSAELGADFGFNAAVAAEIPIDLDMLYEETDVTDALSDSQTQGSGGEGAAVASNVQPFLF